MSSEKSVWIFPGPFGRATVNLNDRALVEHTHRQINILIKLGGGDAMFIVDGRQLTLSNDTMLLFNPWLPHAKLANEGDATLILSLFIEPEWFCEALDLPITSVDGLFADQQVDLHAEVKALAVQLGAAIAAQGRTPPTTAEAVLRRLIQTIAEAHGIGDSEGRSQRWMIDYRIRRALAYIHEHSLAAPQIAEIAREVGMSRSRFFEQFRNCVGTSPQQYVDYIRMTAATRLLSSSEIPLAELACELGFAGHSNFTRFFTQHIGVSPREFRRQTMGNPAMMSTLDQRSDLAA